jgi:hypothetical protein
VPAQARGAQRGQQPEGLHRDPGGTSEAQQHGVAVPDPAVRDAQVQPEHRDDHEVVEHRRPHHRAEPVPGAQHLAEQREQAVEEDLRQAVAGQRDGQLPLPAGEVGGVRADQQRRGEDGERGDRHECHRAQRQQAVGVGLPAVVVLLGGADQFGHEHRLQRTADHQGVDDVRHRVGHPEGVAVRRRADRRGDHRQPHEPRGPRDQRTGHHHAAAAPLRRCAAATAAWRAPAAP